MRFAIPLLTLAFLGACTSGGSDDDSNDDSGATDDTGGGDGGGGGGDDTGGGGGGGGGACGVYSSADDVGATWSWQVDPDDVDELGMDGQWMDEASGSAQHAGRDVWTVTSTGVWQVEGVDDYQWSSILYVVCDAQGVWLSGVDFSYSMTVGGTVYDGWTETVYDPMPLTLPPQLSLGDSWQSTGTGTTIDNYGTSNNVAVDNQFEVVDSGSVSVPAGTFQALEVHSDIDGAGAYWIAEGVGTIQVEGYSQLLDWTH